MLAGETFQDVVDVKPIEQHFEEQGLTFDDIDTFIQTHLDWDHCMNTIKFRKSKILIQSAEWERIPVHPLFSSTYAPRAHYEADREPERRVCRGRRGDLQGSPHDADAGPQPGWAVGGRRYGRRHVRDRGHVHDP